MINARPDPFTPVPSAPMVKAGNKTSCLKVKPLFVVNESIAMPV